MAKPGATGGMNSSRNLVSVERDKDMKNVAVISLCRSPSNLLSRKVLHELISIIDELEQDYSYRGAILTSSVQGVFCHGLDLADLYQKSFDKFRDFWKALQDTWIRLYTTRLVTIAAINGTAVAGGCLLAISCDYRIMAKGSYSIGLPETVLGLSSSSWIFEIFSRLIGSRQAEMSLQLGIEYPVKEAAEIGLIDKDVHHKKLMDVCKEEMTRWLKIPDFSRIRAKRMIREPVALKLQGNPEGDTQNMYSYISEDVVQNTLGNVLKKFDTPSK